MKYRYYKRVGNDFGYGDFKYLFRCSANGVETYLVGEWRKSHFLRESHLIGMRTNILSEEECNAFIMMEELTE